jgi:hypothetical protein
MTHFNLLPAYLLIDLHKQCCVKKMCLIYDMFVKKFPWLFSECGEPDIGNAFVSSFNGTVLLATCVSGYVPDTVRFQCLGNGTWIWDDRCTLPYG